MMYLLKFSALGYDLKVEVVGVGMVFASTALHNLLKAS